MADDALTFVLDGKGGKHELLPYGLNGLMLQKNFSAGESWGSAGGFAMTVSVGSTRRLFTDDDYWAIYRKLEEVKNILQGRIYNEDPKIAERAAQDKKAILACFDGPIQVQEIPNGYCSDYCCTQLPWFIVTTARGPITIGWRKRVINLDWSASDIKANGEELFEDVVAKGITVGKNSIHAYSYGTAQEHIKRLLES